MIRIVTDSASSIPASVAAEHGIDVISMYVHHNGEEYVDAEMDIEAFYRNIGEMVNNLPTSSQPSYGTFDRFFTACAEAKDQVLGIFISRRMSGTFETALASARRIKEQFADFTFAIIDSSSNSYEEVWPALAAARVRQAGGTLKECADAAIASIRSTRWLFTPESLTFLRAGGRIGNAKALLGNLLKLCPVLTVSDGETATFSKARTQIRALDKIAGKFKEDITEHFYKNAVVHYIGDKAPAVAWAKKAIEPIVHQTVKVIPVSPVIGTHVGPAIGIVYECEQPLEGKVSFDPSELVVYSK